MPPLLRGLRDGRRRRGSAPQSTRLRHRVSYISTQVGHSGIDPHALPAVVSVDWNNTANPEGNASAMRVEPGFAGCAVDQFVVVTERQNIVGGTLVSEPANDVGFTIIVP